MKNLRILGILPLIFSLFFVGCEKASVENDASSDLTGLVILNNGNWGDNNGSVMAYDAVLQDFTDVFKSANNKALGDLGQDILVLGDDIYISVQGSQVIFVCDRNFRVKKEIKVSDSEGNQLSPNYFAASADKVYVTLYEGWLGEIDPSEDYAVRITEVGPNPVGLACVSGKIYVANSGGYVQYYYNNTLSVVDETSFKEVSTIEVNVNPQTVVANSGGNLLYVSSLGNYGDIAPKLEVVNLSDGSVHSTSYSGVSEIARGADDTLYILCGGYDSSWNPLPGTVYAHNMALNSGKGVFSEIKFEKAYKISADSRTGNVFVTASDYKTNGDVYVLDRSGKLLSKFDSRGLNPVKALFL